MKEILFLEKEFTDTNYERLKKEFSYIENNLIGYDDNVYLAVES